jgi:hypothetical protein
MCLTIIRAQEHQLSYINGPSEYCRSGSKLYSKSKPLSRHEAVYVDGGIVVWRVDQLRSHIDAGFVGLAGLVEGRAILINCLKGKLLC